MSHYLKKSLFSLVILMISHMNSISKAMDTEDEYSIPTSTYQIQIMKDDKNHVPTFLKQSNSSHLIRLEDSSTPWGSYLISHFKPSIQSAHDFLLLSTNNPKLAAVVGLSYIIPAVSAACECYCSYPTSGICYVGTGYYLGTAPDLLTCTSVCVENSHLLGCCTQGQVQNCNFTCS